ncbi:sensor histidine kinase [Idiomarina tyrosinivorans]|uniref:histidine kinase n=1 Tax=Idiomarina tyrosinivorans TaxID=1445662 RepID=A0A432ZPZ9_9GAMM|nr:HAMP domain-containing sensor histidine kinase [Idiomarina tyrosinivorans]RUO79953.1 sensor histidine kinase [Idiomarina tyrosinivorans]
MKPRRTRWYRSLSLRLLVLFWVLLFITASSGYLLAVWKSAPPKPEPLSDDIRNTLQPLLSDFNTFQSMLPGRLVAGDYRVAAKLSAQGPQRLLIDEGMQVNYGSMLLPMLESEKAQQLALTEWLFVGPFSLEGTRLILARPLKASELYDKEQLERQTQDARAYTLIIGSGLFALLLGFWLVRPIKRLIGATREIAKGSLEPTLKRLPKRGDEIGELARALQTTARDLAISRDAQRRLLSDVSHELRSPMARMQVAVDLGEPEDAESNPHWQQLRRDIDRLSQIIDRILSLSRLENGLVELEKQPLDLAKLVDQLIDDLSYADSEAEKRLQRIGGDNLLVNSDAELLRLIIENLSRNALHYSDGKVQIQLQDGAEEYQISIRDHGPGVDEQTLAKLFTPFYRGDPARNHKAGVGLGLALSQRATRVLGGEINAANHPQGGLQVTIRLPLD